MKMYKLFGVTENWREEKAEYKEAKKRIEALPEDYKFIFKQIEEYMWTFSDNTGEKMLDAMYDLIAMFEEGVANGSDVFDLTGNDVGEFADGIVKEVANTWIEARKRKLNTKVRKYRETGK